MWLPQTGHNAKSTPQKPWSSFVVQNADMIMERYGCPGLESVLHRALNNFRLPVLEKKSGNPLRLLSRLVILDNR